MTEQEDAPGRADPSRTNDHHLAFVVGGYLLYGLVHGLIARAAGPALALDDTKLNIVTQSLQGGYMTENPPLFEWFLVLVQQATGPTLASFLIVKYVWLTLAGLFTYLAAREVTKDRNWSLLTASALLLFYQLGWNFHQAFTHSTVLIASIAFFWWALIRLKDHQRAVDFALLGAALGVGILSKYSFIPAAAIGLACAARSAEWRKALTRPAALLLPFFAGSIATPHLLWLLSENRNVGDRVAARLQGETAGYFARIAEGVPEALWAIISYGLPFLAIAIWAFGRQAVMRAPTDPVARLARDATFAGGIGLIAAVLLLGMSGMQERYAIPFLFPMVFWIMVGAWSNGQREATTRKFVVGTGVFAVLVIVVRVAATASPGAPFCKDCRQFVPYGPLAAAIRDAEFDGGTLVGFEDHTAGNLRRLFPDARVISSHLPNYTPAHRVKKDIGTDCWFIWSEDLGPPPPQHVLASVDPETAFSVTAGWRENMRGPQRTTSWTIAPMNHDAERVRELCRVY